ncbi:MAG: dephospho-CoA kinase [Verrucomicrobiales bacterium]|jgi:dephospho-CoA kinase
MPESFVIALTGGIAMGKSTAAQFLLKALPASSVLFDADAAVQQLLTNPDIVAKISQEFGDSVLSSDGQLDRPRLREQVFDSAQQRATLENILHPVVRKRYEDERQRLSASADQRVLLADIPLLFESDYRFEHDLSITLAASPETQIRRLADTRGLPKDLAKNIIAAQMPINEKMERADVVLWNEGRLARLEQQINDFTQWLRKKKKILN